MGLKEQEYKKVKANENKLDDKVEVVGDNFSSDMYKFLQDVYAEIERRYILGFVEAYKAYNLVKIDRQFQLYKIGLKTASNVKYPLVKMYVDSLFSDFYDANIRYRVYPRNKEDYDKAELVQDLIEWVMDISGGNDSLFKAAYDGLIVGNAWLKLSIYKDIEEGKYLKGIDKKGRKQYGTYKRKTVLPKIEMFDVFTIFPDPAINNVQQGRFIFHRKILPYKDVKKIYSQIFGINLSDAKWNYILKSPRYISTKDYTKIKDIQTYQDFILAKLAANADKIANMTTGTTYDSALQDIFSWGNYFQVSYGDNDLVEVIEYYERGKLVILFNGYVVYDDVSIYPFSGFPFELVKYEKASTSLYGKGPGLNLVDIQKISDSVWNGYLDLVKKTVNPMYEVDENSVFEGDLGGQTLDYIPNKIIKKRGDKKAIQPIDIVPNKILGPDGLALIHQTIEYSEGPNQYTMGGGPVERSATGASLKAQIVKKRLKPLADSINKALSGLSEKLLLLLASIYGDKIAIRIKGKNGGYTFKDIKPADIIGQYDIIFETESLKESMKEIERNQLIQFISQALPAAQDPLRQRPVIDIYKLFEKIIDVFDLPKDVILDDERYKMIIENLMASQQTAQIEAQEKVNKYMSKKQKNTKQQQQELTPEMLAEVAQNEPVNTPSPQEPSKEQQNEIKRELWKLQGGGGGLAALLQKYMNPNR